jgi:Uma2 family endonuclease
MPIIKHWTSKDLEALPDDEWQRYEIIDGELYVSTAPSWHHQYACRRLTAVLDTWCLATGQGEVIPGPGLIFAPDQDVIPDLVWVSHARLQGGLDAAGHLTRAPELVVEVTSPGTSNARRDREVKRALYSRQGVEEYWVIDPLAQRVEIYRQQDGRLLQVEALSAADTLTSPHLPGFQCAVSTLFHVIC